MNLITLLLLAMVDLVPGTTSTWTDGTYTWAGNPGCAEAGFLLQSDSPAIDQGALIPDFHCPFAGPSSHLNSDGSPCAEWYGAAPDIGACEYVGGTPPPPPSGFPVVLNSTQGSPPEEKTIIFQVTKPAGATTATIAMAVNDGEQCDEGKLYINGNSPVQLWVDNDPTYIPDPNEPCNMPSRNGVDATATIRTDASWWNDGGNQVRFVHDKITSSGFIVNSITVSFDVIVSPPMPTDLKLQ